MSQHCFCNFPNLCRDNICLCRDKIHLSLMLCLLRHKTYMSRQSLLVSHSWFLNVVLRHKIYLGLYIRWNVYRNIEILCRNNFVMSCLIVLLFSIATKLSFVATEFI